jgi:hypothetical protein
VKEGAQGRPAVVQAALKIIESGKYRYGQSRAPGWKNDDVMDCSEFVYQAYRAANLPIPALGSHQMAQTFPAIADPLAGDIVYWEMGVGIVEIPRSAFLGAQARRRAPPRQPSSGILRRAGEVSRPLGGDCGAAPATVLVTVLLGCALRASAAAVDCESARGVVDAYLRTVEEAAKTQFADVELLRRLKALVVRNHEGRQTGYLVYRSVSIRSCMSAEDRISATVDVVYRLIGRVGYDPEKPKQESEFAPGLRELTVSYRVLAPSGGGEQPMIADVTMVDPLYTTSVALEDFEDRLDSGGARAERARRAIAEIRKLSTAPEGKGAEQGSVR